MRLRVVSWNVHSCMGPDGRHDPDRTVDVLDALAADVVGLQEVDWRRDWHGRAALDHLAERLGLTAVEGPNLRDHRGQLGNALLTRLPIEAVTRHSLAEPGREPRGVIDARLRHPAGPLRVLVTHLGLRRRERLRQERRLRAAVVDGSGHVPTLLLGDLNEWRPRPLAAPLLVPDPFPAATSARTFPGRWPLLALDRVLARPAPSLFVARAVGTSAARAASDHLPLVVDVAWAGGADEERGPLHPRAPEDPS